MTVINTTISVIIPVKPGGSVKALHALSSVDYPSELFEVLVAEGCQPSRQRNEAARMATGDILYFLDDDSRVSPDFMKRAVEDHAEPDVAAVGGPSLTPATDTALQKAFGIALSSIAGGGAVRNRYRRSGVVRKTNESELILCNLSFKRSIFLASGGLDERLYPNEENELMERLRLKGCKLIHDPDLAVTRSQRKTYSAFIRQLFGYGWGRAEQIRLGGGGGFIHLIPSLFLIYLALFPLFAYPLYSLPLLCYAIVIAFFTVDAARTASFPTTILLPVVFPTLHLSYGAGFIAGLLFPRFKRKRSKSEVAIVKVKEKGRVFPSIASMEARRG